MHDHSVVPPVVKKEAQKVMKRGDGMALLAIGTVLSLLAVIVAPWKAVAVVTIIVVASVTLLRPQWSLFFLAAYTPFEPFLLKFVPDDLYIYARYFSEGLVYLLVLAVALRLLTREKRWLSTPIDLPFVFFLLVAGTSLLVNTVPPVIGVLGIRQIIRFILLFFVIAYLQPEEKFIRKLTGAMFLIVAFQGVLGLAQAVVGAPLDEFLIPSERKFYESIQLTSGTTQFWSPGTRVFATLGRYDQLGTFLCFFLLLAIGLWYYREKTPKFMRQGRHDDGIRRALPVALLAAPAFLLTLSRASWFGLVFGLFVIGAVLMKDWRIRLAYAGAVGLALGYLAVSGITVKYLTDYAGQTPVERFFEAFSYERWRGEYYGLGRVFWMVQTPTVVVRSSPLVGVGPGQYGGGAAAALGNTEVYEKLNLPFGVYGTDGYIDNNWFSLWGETGTLGLAFYIWMFVALWGMTLTVWRKAKDPMLRGLALGFAGCMVALTFQAFLATYLEVRTIALYFWMYAAFIYVLGRREGIVGPEAERARSTRT